MAGHGGSSPVGRDHRRWFNPTNHEQAFACLFPRLHIANEAQTLKMDYACFYLSLRVLSSLFFAAML